MANNFQTGLVLQGGGALGAYELGAAKRLYEYFDTVGDTPQVIAGVSIGAINAAVLAGARGHDPVSALTRLWKRFAISSPGVPTYLQPYLSAFGNPPFYESRQDYWNLPTWTSCYSTEPLKRTLREFVDFDRINSHPSPELLVSATNITSGEIEYFDNVTQEHGPLTVDHIVASGSLPPGFPMTKIKHESYWDGGLFNNTPLSPVVHRLARRAGGKKRIFVVNLFPKVGHIPNNMTDVLNRVMEIIFSNKTRHDTKYARAVNEYLELFEAMEKAVPPARRGALAKFPAYRRLKRYAQIEVIEIERTEPEQVNGASDFSADTLQRRIDAGYRDADAVVSDLEAAETSSAGVRAVVHA